MLVIRELSTDNEVWDKFIMQHPSGTLFHKTSWLDILAKAQSLKLKKIGFYKDGILVGVLPLFIKNCWPLRVAASPFVVEDTPYMGLVIDDGLFQEAAEMLGPYIKENDVHFLRIIQQEKISPQMRPCSFQVIEKHTHLLDLTKSEEEIFSSMEGRCRTAIRKAKKNGVRIQQETYKNGLESYYTILKNVYAKQDMQPPNSKEFYDFLWDAYVDHHLYMLTAWQDETMIAGAIILHDRDRCYYLNGCSRHEYRSLCPGHLIQWEAMRLAKSLGANWYDFVGSDIERLANFKKSFGGELTTYSCLEKSSSAWVSFIRRKYPEVKMLLGRIKSRLSHT